MIESSTGGGNVQKLVSFLLACLVMLSCLHEMYLVCGVKLLASPGQELFSKRGIFACGRNKQYSRQSMIKHERITAGMENIRLMWK